MMQSSAIKIGARTYAIACLSDDDFDQILALKGVYDDDVKSFIDYDEQLIVVRERLQADHRRELITHELVHAALDDAGCPQDERSEQIIAALSPRLNDMIMNGLIIVLKETCSHV